MNNISFKLFLKLSFTCAFQESLDLEELPVSAEANVNYPLLYHLHCINCCHQNMQIIEFPYHIKIFPRHLSWHRSHSLLELFTPGSCHQLRQFSFSLLFQYFKRDGIGRTFLSVSTTRISPTPWRNCSKHLKPDIKWSKVN